MKNALRMLIVVFVLAIVAAAIFLATFDVDRYRPQLLAQLQQALGRPVTLDRISLGWQQGIAVRLQNLAIYEGPPASGEPPFDSAQGGLPSGVEGEPLMQVESVHGVLALMPLLSKRVHVASIVLTRPKILVMQDAQGNVNVLGLLAAMSPGTVSGRKATVQGTPVSFEVAVLRIEDGAVHWVDAMSRPRTELWLNAFSVTLKHLAPGTPMDIDARGAIGGDVVNARLRGRMTLPGNTRAGSVEQAHFTLERLSLESILPRVSAGEPQLQGVLTMRVQGQLPTLDPEQVSRAISGSGTLALEEPRVVNLNILRAVFERFSMIPGLVQALESRLPQEYQAKFDARDTTLSPLNVSVELNDGALRFEELRIDTDTLRLSGSGSVGFDGLVAIQSILRIEPTLSAAIVSSVNELQALTNQAGEIELPLMIQGQTSRLVVLPDLTYVASRVLVTKVQDLLGSLLQKALEEEAPAEASVVP